MKRAIGKYWRNFATLIGMILVALGVGGFILAHERLYLPKWVPFVGSDFVDRTLELQTGKSLVPGQGQELAIAGVKVGEISKVDLVNGRAVVTVSIRRNYDDRIMRDATALIRPKTGLEDMTIQLDPGSPQAGRLPPGQPIPIQQTLPYVSTDEVLASLDGDTRDYLRLLLAGGGQALHGNSRALSNTLRRFEPTGRELLRISSALAQRRVNISRAIHNFRLLTQTLGTKDQQISQLVDSSNAVFGAFANEERNLRTTIRLLPGALTSTQRGLTKADRLARVLRPNAVALQPVAHALAPALRQSRPFFRQTTPIVRNQLRPFARAALPTVRALRPAARDLSNLVPDLRTSLSVVNELLNELGYNPPGPEEGYLFWNAWANHDGASVFSSQDAQGPIRHGLTVVSCSSLNTLSAIAGANPQLGVVIQLLGVTNPVTRSQACPSQAGPGSSPTQGPTAAKTRTRSGGR